MEETVIVDCETGRVRRRELTPDEDAQRQRDVVDGEREQRRRQVEDAAREGVLTQAAQKIGVPVDDLKTAFGTGRREASRDPARQRRVQEHRDARRRNAEAAPETEMETG